VYQNYYLGEIMHIILFIFPLILSIAFVYMDKKYNSKGKLMICGALILFIISIFIISILKIKENIQMPYYICIIMMFGRGIDERTKNKKE
jgi:hypothetical protein